MYITIIGMGRIGQAIQHLLKSEHTIECYDTDPSKLITQKPIEDIIPHSEIIFLCVPSWALRTSLLQIRPWISKNTSLVCLSKGIDEQTTQTMDEILEQVLPTHAFAMLIGPMMAEELLQDRGGVGVLACSQKELFKTIRDIFDPSLKLIPSTEVHAIALAGVLKNIYAMGLGIADALLFSQNYKGWFVSRAIEEMMVILKTLGYNPDILLGPAGLADFIATGFSPYSNNRAVGEAFVKGGADQKRGGGSVSITPLLRLIGSKEIKLPLLFGLDEIVNHGANPQIIYKKIFEEDADF